MTAQINLSDAALNEQTVSARNPEVFITHSTASSTLSAYSIEFPSATSSTNGVVTNINLTDLNGNNITATDFL